MCGIAGVVSEAADRKHVERMLGRLTHRGPDDQGIHVGRGAVLGARRLSIIDIAGGHQPITNEDGSVVAVQNGEIYNFRELRAMLASRGHTMRTQSDTEILPHLYEEYGLSFVTHLRGMFALAIWDQNERRLVLARDRLGKKPLVYAQGARGIVFASEIAACLVDGGVARDVDDAAIAEYLTYGYIPAPRTGFRGLRKVAPASIVVSEDGRLRETPYWKISFEPKERIGFPEAAERVRDAIEDAVRVRLMSDVPLGALLSGGLDSSAVVAFMARHSDQPVKTFSIGFGEADFDELAYARIVARAFATEHHEFVVEPSALEILPTLVRHFGEPFADSSAVPTYHVARIAREHVTVALNGDGGDELFGGYPRYRAVALASMVDRMPLLRAALSGFSRLPWPLPAGPRAARVRRLLTGLAADSDERYFRWMGYFNGARREALAGHVRSERTDSRWLAGLADAASARDPRDRAMACDLLGYLPGDLLAKMDIATMACSLEARSPLLDHRLVELVATLPTSYKVNSRGSKLLLRAAMRDILPAEILNRGKMGFGVPVGRWLRGPLRSLVGDVVLAPSAFARGYLDERSVRELVADHMSGRADRTPHVWALLMLELWFRECVESPAFERSGAVA